ncbi:hypothetical protein [Streptomyces sp. bgisy091]|uniref:hypothetical protein n=1 Tax=Streptomyces sp. bgisy091 TaxID=3413778 RepID=UPI003D747C47
MNPPDATERPGAHLVAKEFGIEDPWALGDNHPLRDPLDLVGRLVAKAARDVDELHGQVTRAAQSALDLLAPLARGEHASMRGWHGALQTTGPQIEPLVARRGAAYEQLTRSVSAYHRLLPDPDAAQRSATKAHELHQDQGSGRSDDWARDGGAERGTVEIVAPDGQAGVLIDNRLSGWDEETVTLWARPPGWGTRAEAVFTARTPSHLIAATAAVMADSAPVIREHHQINRRLEHLVTLTPVGPTSDPQVSPAPPPLDVRRTAVTQAVHRATRAPRTAADLHATAYFRSLRWGCWLRAWPKGSRLCMAAGSSTGT